MKRRGFTLVELLVVVAAVLILSSLLVPVFAKSRKEVATPCQQNIRQVALGLKMYLSDYDECFPLVRDGQQVYGWADAAQPYLRTNQLLQCPSDKHKPPLRAPGTDSGFTDYFYNSHLAGVNESNLTYIASTVMLGDARPGNARRHSNGGASPKPGTAQLENEEGDGVGAATRHEGGANYAFADGHVKWYKGTNANTCPTFRNAASGLDGTFYGFSATGERKASGLRNTEE